MAGERPFVVSKIAGRSSIKTTTARYGHFIPGGRRITDSPPRSLLCRRDRGATGQHAHPRAGGRGLGVLSRSGY